jgi:uncharacterized protein with NRDE domain
MCTVTIIPKGKNDFVLTSNRDEAPNRISLAPEVYVINGTKLLFPKDKLSGGTWIGISEKNRLVCVLNGGFELHKRKASYRLSRGVVAKDFLVSENIIDTVNAYNLDNIEPFTMVIADWNMSLKFYELVWDGNKKIFSELSLEPKIWSSSTLYNQTMKTERKQWFETFKNECVLNSQTLLQFHKTTGKNNVDYGVVMDRGFVKTTSITQVEKTGDSIKMIYENLINQTVTKSQFNLPSNVNG